MKQIKALIIFLFTGILLYAQAPVDFNNYQPLQCAGTIPEDFLTLSQEKFRQDVKSETKSSGHHVDQSKQEFLLKTNFIIDELLLSGKVLFGDTVTAYINRIAARVLANEPELRSKLRFYCLKSAEPNAFSTNQGIIFVTLGLIAQLENEAQLAFVLSHEIVHYEKRHAINAYTENESIFGNRSYKYNSYEDKIRMASDYSKENELEADKLGFERLINTGYNCEESIGALFVLQFSELPFEDFEFDVSMLEKPFMKIPADLVLDSVRPIDLEGDMEDDTYSSHPNLATRRKALEKLIERSAETGTARFIENESAFQTIRKIARFETVRMQLQTRDYCGAFYNSFVLLIQDSGSHYLKVCAGKAMYALAKYKNHDAYSDIGEYYGQIEGSQQRVNFLFQKLTAPQLNLIALRYLYDLSVTDPSYSILAMRDDLAGEAVRMNDARLEDMQKSFKTYQEAKKILADTVKIITPVETSQVIPVTDSVQSGYVSKYDKLRQEKKKKEITQVIETKKADESKFYMLAFADVLDDAEVKRMFEEMEIISDKITAEKKEEDERTKKMSSYEYRKIKENEKKMKKKEILYLGIDTVVFVDPFYYMVDDRKGLQLINSENQLLEFGDQIISNATLAGLDYALLNPKAFEAGDVDKYNDMATINDWIGERFEHEDFEMIPLETDRVLPLTQKYNTSHFCYTGVFTTKQRRDNIGGVLLFSVLCYPLLPLGIIYACTPQHHTYYYTLVYDVATGKEELNHTAHLRSKSKNGFINSLMYDTFLQMRKRGKAQKLKQ